MAICAAMLALAVPLAFAQVLNDYLLADSFSIVGKVDFSAARQYLTNTTGFGRNEFRPLIPLSYAVDNFFWGERPFGYHLSNLLIHVISSVSILFLFRRLTGSVLTAFVSAVLFALEPAHHSRVAWIAARDSAICLMFLLLSWLAYMRQARQSESAIPPVSKTLAPGTWRFISAALFLLALLSYEGAVAFPFILLAQELLVSGASRPWLDRLKHAGLQTLPWFILTGAYVIWWMLLFDGSLAGYDLLVSLRGIVENFYRLHYRLFYHIQHWLGLAYLAAFVWLWRHRRNLRPLLGFSIATIWLGYLPYMQVRGFADRFSMLSVIGVALMLGLCANSLGQGWDRAWPGKILPLILVLIFTGYYAWGTCRRARQWAEAGAQAETILSELYVAYPRLPENATLVFDRVPTMHQNAYLFPTGFSDAFRRRYRRDFPELYYFASDAADGFSEQLPSGRKLLHFRYFPDKTRFVQINAP